MLRPFRRSASLKITFVNLVTMETSHIILTVLGVIVGAILLFALLKGVI